MLSRQLNAIRDLLNSQLKKPMIHNVRASTQGKRLMFRFVFCGSLILSVLLTISFFASTKASYDTASLTLDGIAGWSAISSSPVQIAESVDTFDSTDCATPKSTFVLGETVCAQVNGAPLPFFGFRQRRFQWVTPNGSVVQQTEITTDPQTDTYTIPTTGPFAQVGTWAVRTIKNNGSTVSLVRFVVRDPANLRADLSVTKFGPLQVKSGNNATYSISIENRGPDDAANVSFSDTVPANMSFVDATQTSGPTFNCSHPTPGGTGTSTCTLATLAQNETATFTFTYEVAAGTPVDTTIDNTVSVSSATTELNPADNSATAPVTVTGAGSGGSECVITCPADITVVAGANQSGANVSYPDPTTTGSACGAVSCSHISGAFYPIGTTTVVCVAETGDPCNFNITVQDNQDPTISCPADISTAEDPAGSGSATVSYPAPTASDNSGVVSVSCDYASPSSFPVGTTTVTCTATDEANNTASCSFDVTVTGDGCVLTCPSNITVNADAGSCGAVVTYPDPTGTTECGTITSTPASGSTFPVGTTTVQVTSSSGQNCSFTVTVVDNQLPTISCPAPITVTASSGSCNAIVNPGTATTTDNCSGATVSAVRSDGESMVDLHYPVGTTTITWTATDASGNTSSCEQFITVRDLTAPVVTVNVPPAVANVNPDASCQALVPDISEFVIATDNCPPIQGLTITQSPVADTVVGPGVHPITITVLDGDPDQAHNTTVVVTNFTVNSSTCLLGVGPTSIWLGLKNSDSVGTKFDVLAQAYRNGVLVGSGQIDSVPGGSSGFNNAVLRTIDMSLSGTGGFPSGTTLAIKVSVRIATTGHTSGTARLWFNDAAANSRFAATVGGTTTTYYLRDGFVLATTPGPGPKKTIDVLVNRNQGGNPFKPFGTWTKTF